MLRTTLVLLMVLFVSTAEAYIGPGSGIGLLGSLWAWLVGFVLVLLAIMLWPLRWSLRRLRARRQAANETASSGD